jgi:hypothetical protein
MSTRCSFSISNLDRYFVFITATAENPVSHKYVVTKGSETITAFSDGLG